MKSSSSKSSKRCGTQDPLAQSFIPVLRKLSLEHRNLHDVQTLRALKHLRLQCVLRDYRAPPLSLPESDLRIFGVTAKKTTSTRCPLTLWRLAAAAAAATAAAAITLAQCTAVLAKDAENLMHRLLRPEIRRETRRETRRAARRAARQATLRAPHHESQTLCTSAEYATITV
jgi:hypothetical protein